MELQEYKPMVRIQFDERSVLLAEDKVDLFISTLMSKGVAKIDGEYFTKKTFRGTSKVQATDWETSLTPEQYQAIEDRAKQFKRNLGRAPSASERYKFYLALMNNKLF